ncbi:guanylate cyclase 32e [Plakobranchus ocellatus]|uniref:Guanylate cyclase 32e n=1 Tax=Plakobranchus ocellatus TaxID=259542 RepID=A0AAV4BN40_9GAST|nr:guanylate cyclase 32e [Plakobranchus ocellatus]
MGNVASFHGVVEAALLSKVKRRSQILHFLHGSPDYRAQQVLFCAHSTSVLTPQSTVQRHRSIRNIMRNRLVSFSTQMTHSGGRPTSVHPDYVLPNAFLT